MEKKIVTVREIKIGVGQPKICVPLVAGDEIQLQAALEQLEGIPFDLVEWRADFYRDVENQEVRRRAFEKIRKSIGERPLLFTFRTFAEGGNREISSAAYFALNRAVGESRQADLVDIEIDRDEKEAAALGELLHRAGVYALGSNHDFEKTPETGEMVRRLCRMQELNMDITKLAVMPKCRRDVLRLLEAAVEMEENKGDRPCITMSMGNLGMISRIAGSLTGSAITFGTVGRASAPGQFSAKEAAEFLRMFALS